MVKIIDSIRAAVADAGHYVNLVSKLGDASRDKGANGSFNKVELSDEQLDAAYSDWVAAKIVNKPAFDMLRGGWFYENISDAQLESLQAEFKRLNTWEVLQSALILSRLHGVSYVLKGVADNTPLDKELLTIGQGRLEYFVVLKKSKVKEVKEYLALNESKGELDQPAYYDVLLGKQKVKVHHSRLIIFKNQKVLGEKPESVLQTVYNEVLRHASVKASAASLVHESKIDVIKTPGLVAQIKEDLAAVTKRFGAMAFNKSINGMILLDEKEEYETKNYAFGGLPELMREYSLQVAGAAWMPYTTIFGDSPSGLNATGESDIRNYYDTLSSWQQWSLKPRLLDVLDCICLSAFGGSVPGLNVVFNDLWQLDAKTRSEVERNNAERDIKYLDAGVITELNIAQQLQIDKTYSSITAQDLNDLKLISERGNTDDNSSNN